MSIKVLYIFLYLGYVECSSYSQNRYYFGDSKYYGNDNYCTDLSPYYGDIDLDQITGVWYGIEKIPHAKGEYKIEHTQECFYIDIKEIDIKPTPPTPYPPLNNMPYANRQFTYTEPYRIRYFVLEWHEGLWHDDYHIKVNTSHKGFWPTDLPDGSVDNQYRFFGGLIQVLKVANNHLVLNFCMKLPHSQHYSVILARNENQLTPEDLASIHNVFTQKHLSTSALKRVCENSADIPTTPSFIFILISILYWTVISVII